MKAIKIFVSLSVFVTLVFGCDFGFSTPPNLEITSSAWTTSTEVMGELTIGNVHLTLVGKTYNAEKVTVETYGDGILHEEELTLFNGSFSDSIIIAFTTNPGEVSPGFTKSTKVRAYKGGIVMVEIISSQALSY